jgi:hypothetical protein
MSIYKLKDTALYHYDFQYRGHRFCGSTQTANRRDAEAAERQAKEDAKRYIEQQAAVTTSLALSDVCNRYWQQVGQHHAASRNMTFPFWRCWSGISARPSC